MEVVAVAEERDNKNGLGTRIETRAKNQEPRTKNQEQRAKTIEKFTGLQVDRFFFKLEGFLFEEHCHNQLIGEHLNL
jgi:hypothetical protein